MNCQAFHQLLCRPEAKAVDCRGRGGARVLRLLAALSCWAMVLAAEPEARPIRLGFSKGVFLELNENDARASVKLWVRMLSQERDIPADPNVRIYDALPALAEGLRRDEVDCVTITSQEYWKLREQVRFGRFLFSVVDGSVFEEFALLVRQDSAWRNLGDLRGRSLIIFQSSRTSLAGAWLDTQLLQQREGPTAAFFARVGQQDKLSRAVLPVFFGQMDACLITRKGFQTMVELNPQVGKQLRILTASPAVVPTVCCLRADYPAKAGDKFMTEMRNIQATPAGQQVMTVFQSQRMEEHPVTVLDGTCRILEEHVRLLSHLVSKTNGPTAPMATTP